MNALVELRGEVVRTDSLKIASEFGKRHDSILRTVRELVSGRSDLAHNFVEMVQTVQIGSGAKRGSRYYEMDRKGFVLLVMGFTGPKALDCKIAFIDAFDRMEAMLMNLHADNDGGAMALAETAAPTFMDRLRCEPIQTQLAFVREMRLAKGRHSSLKAMKRLGWDDDEEADELAEIAAGSPVAAQLLGWLTERTERMQGARCRSSILHDDYLQWCMEHGQTGASQVRFSVALHRLGFAKDRFDGGRQHFLGLRLKG